MCSSLAHFIVPPDSKNLQARKERMSMGRNDSPQAIGARKGAVLLAAAVVIAMLATLMATTPAWASSPSGVSVKFYKYDPALGMAQQVATTQAKRRLATRSPSPQRARSRGVPP